MKIGSQIKVRPKGMRYKRTVEVVKFHTLPSGKELIIIRTKKGNTFPITRNEIVE